MSFYKAMQSDNIIDCCVIGAGAAGMMAAITAARNGAGVVLLEHTSKLGTKILQTGNGKCNFTNYHMVADKFSNADKDFVDEVLAKFNYQDTIEFFESIGVYHKERNGYVYPLSETAASLVEALKYELYRLKVQTVTEVNISELAYNDEVWAVMSDKDTYYCSSVIIATGSKAAPKTGSDGSGYRIAERLGHRVIKPLPALVQLVSDCACCKSMAGVRSVGTVKVTADGKEIASDTGEIQYTDYGISGIPVFQVSRYAVKALDEGADVKAVIDMFPGLSHEQLREYIEKQYEIAAHKTIEDFFGGLINKKLVSAAAKTAGVDGFTKVYKTDMDVLTGIACSMKTFVVNITGYKGFDNGQICQGGVDLSEISAKTCQSKICPGVYFAGEILDVDGPCGGYNLQWAWSSGYVAGMAASERAMNGEINHEC